MCPCLRWPCYPATHMSVKSQVKSPAGCRPLRGPRCRTACREHPDFKHAAEFFRGLQQELLQAGYQDLEADEETLKLQVSSKKTWSYPYYSSHNFLTLVTSLFPPTRTSKSVQKNGPISQRGSIGSTIFWFFWRSRCQQPRRI